MENRPSNLITGVPFDGSKNNRNNDGEEPPSGGDDLEKRVENLEKKFNLILEKLSNIEVTTSVTNEKINSTNTRIDNLKENSATKENLSKMQNTLLIWLFGVLVTCGATLIRVFFY